MWSKILADLANRYGLSVNISIFHQTDKPMMKGGQMQCKLQCSNFAPLFLDFVTLGKGIFVHMQSMTATAYSYNWEWRGLDCLTRLLCCCGIDLPAMGEPPRKKMKQVILFGSAVRAGNFQQLHK